MGKTNQLAFEFSKEAEENKTKDRKVPWFIDDSKTEYTHAYSKCAWCGTEMRQHMFCCLECADNYWRYQDDLLR